jgi:hypothetical protein
LARLYDLRSIESQAHDESRVFGERRGRFLAEIVRWDCTLFQHIGEGGRNFSGSVLTVDAGSTA